MRGESEGKAGAITPYPPSPGLVRANPTRVPAARLGLSSHRIFTLKRALQHRRCEVKSESNAVTLLP
jgi:hypothetical protein